MRSFQTAAVLMSALPALGLFTTQASADPFTVTYEAPGVENTTSSFSYVGVENFDSRPTGGGQTFATGFGTTGTSAYQFTGSYSGVQINPTDQYGGAGGTGNYAVTFSTAGYSLDVSALNTATSQAAPINYFGFWLSALDAGNELSFYRGSSLVYSFSPAQVLALIGGNPAYFGNPNAAFQGQDGSEPFVFLNFYDTSGAFDRIAFSEDPVGGGYESDNHTVGYYTGQSGTNVPEPAGVVVLAAGLAGLAVARRRIRP